MKTWPWTQILLGLLLLSSIANLVELRRVKKATDDVDSQLSSEGWLDRDVLNSIHGDLQDGNDSLQNIDKNTDCIENHLRPGCTLQLMPPQR